MHGMGYRNAQRVYDLSRLGKLNTTRGDNARLNNAAMNVLVYMALSSIDWEDEEAKRRNPARCYWRGWTVMADDFGMTLPSTEQTNKAFDNSLDLEELIERRTSSAKNNISQSAKFLRDRGLIKLIKPANTFHGTNAVWLLMLGDDEENREVERFARMRLGIPDKEGTR